MLMACQNNDRNNLIITFYNSAEELHSKVSLANTNNTQGKTESIVFKEVRDPNSNVVVCRMPLPQSWKVNNNITQNNPIFITGSNGIKIYPDNGNNFFYSSDPYINQSMQQKGFSISPIRSVNQLIKEDLEPHAKSQGARLVKTYKLSELISYDKNYDQFVFKSVPQHNRTFDVVATEWMDNKGDMSIMIIHYGTNQNQYQQSTWYYNMQIMEANKNVFNQAKRDYIYALANTKYNPDWVHHNYMRDAKIARKNNEIHISRMNQLRAEGEAILKRGREHSLAVDRNHARFMDAHLEKTNVITTSGQSYKVDAVSNYYWMNSDGQYISSNNPNYNPNQDPNYNNMNWSSTKINN